MADAWRALKSPSLGESSLEGAASGLSTTSPSDGLSVAPGALGDTPHFNTLAGGALGARTGKYNRYGGDPAGKRTCSVRLMEGNVYCKQGDGINRGQVRLKQTNYSCCCPFESYVSWLYEDCSYNLCCKCNVILC